MGSLREQLGAVKSRIVVRETKPKSKHWHKKPAPKATEPAKVEPVVVPEPVVAVPPSVQVAPAPKRNQFPEIRKRNAPN